MRLPTGLQPFATAVALLFSVACNDDNGGPTDPIDPGPVMPTVEVVATGLLAPQGIELDDQGRLWIAEQGTGADDGRISVLTPDGQVHPVLVGLPSNLVQGNPEGVHHLVFLGLADGVELLLGAQGLGEDSRRGRTSRCPRSQPRHRPS
ncbi:MAG: hypothetical protein ACREK5_06045 [Gemmatimonadota bacterium]